MDAPLAKAILARNMRAAQKCTDYSAATPSENSSVQFAVAPRKIGSDICLRLTLDSDAAGRAFVSLPMKQGEGNIFEAGRSVPVPVVGGGQTISLILPGYLSGKDLRIDLSNEAKTNIKLQTIEIGQVGGAS